MRTLMVEDEAEDRTSFVARSPCVLAASPCPPSECGASAHVFRFAEGALAECVRERCRVSSIPTTTSTGQQAHSCEWGSVVGANPLRYAELAHRCIADGAYLGQVHAGDRLTTDQKSAVRVGDGEWVTPISIASQEVPLSGRRTRDTDRLRTFLPSD